MNNHKPKLRISPSEEIILYKKGYKIIAEIGKGSFGKVYLTEYVAQNNPKTKQNKLACKIMNTALTPPGITQKFIPRELDITIKISHPHIVNFHSIIQRDTKYFIFMRYCEHGDLLEFIIKNGAVNEDQARLWQKQITLAVQYLHKLYIAHRDLKCENILITRNFNAKLTDFGFSRYVVNKYGVDLLSSTYCGSISYMAPEIIRSLPYDAKRADIWSLGVILYVMLNKAVPFNETSLKRMYEKQMRKEWWFRNKVVHILSREVKELVRNLLQPNHLKRWSLDKILNSSWMAKDPRFLVLSSAEKHALESAMCRPILKMGKSDSVEPKTPKKENTYCPVKLEREIEYNQSTSSESLSQNRTQLGSETILIYDLKKLNGNEKLCAHKSGSYVSNPETKENIPLKTYSHKDLPKIHQENNG